MVTDLRPTEELTGLHFPAATGGLHPIPGVSEAERLVFGSTPLLPVLTSD